MAEGGLKASRSAEGKTKITLGMGKGKAFQNSLHPSGCQPFLFSLLTSLIKLIC